MDSISVLATGFLAQGFFSARILVQWIMSERARRVLSPSVFWILSVAGAYLLCIYGWLRDDFAIVSGQFISYYVYLWNLRINDIWPKVPVVLRVILLLTPAVSVSMVAGNSGVFAARFLHNTDIPLWLLIFGVSGQVLFTLRFIYQWLYSRRAGKSCLPAGFWVISLAGSLCILAYGFVRLDPVLIVGQSFGLTAYTRNLILIKNEKKRSA